MSGTGLLARGARWLADRERVPIAHRAVLGYYAETGTFDYRAIDLKSRVDDAMAAIMDDLYADVEAALAEEFGVPRVTFAYETKLTLPAELTLGYLFRRALVRAEGGYDPVADDLSETGPLGSLPGVGGRPDGVADRRPANRDAADYAREARETTAFVVRALLDGDMRDAINDDEFEDFVVDVAPAGASETADGAKTAPPDPDPRRVATVAQSCLQSRVEAGFAAYPDAVRAAYDHAVEVSEAHQAQDERFRDLMVAAAPDAGFADRSGAAAGAVDEGGDGDGSGEGEGGDGDGGGADECGDDGGGEHEGAGVGLAPAAARDAIRAEYRHRPMADANHPFTDEELDLPYLASQYDRVGVIYHGMLEMYRAAGFEIEPAFERSVLFAIIGAQVWLDDVDDYADDVREGQLTPVTAEYLLADDDRAAFETIVAVSEAYFDRARTYADAADSTLTGIAVEYILRSGDVSHLPGADGGR
jgi:hypothetical protein